MGRGLKYTRHQDGRMKAWVLRQEEFFYPPIRSSRRRLGIRARTPKNWNSPNSWRLISATERQLLPVPQEMNLWWEELNQRQVDDWVDDWIDYEDYYYLDELPSSWDTEEFHGDYGYDYDDYGYDDFLTYDWD